MVKVPTGRFIKAEEVKDGTVVEFVSEGEQVLSSYKNDDGSEKYNFQIDVLFNGEEKLLNLNVVSRRALIAKYGDDSKEWLGKKAKLSTALTPQNKKMILVNPE